MSFPRITVVTPSYNQGHFLEQTILSVLSQGYPNLEYMVLDGGSTDHSRGIIERYANNLTFWRSSPDLGQAAAIQEGFNRSSGDVLSWLNSDDTLAPGALYHVAEAWALHGPEVAITGGCHVLSESTSGPPHFPHFQVGFNRPEPLPLRRLLDLGAHWLRGAFFYQPEVFFPRTSYMSVGGIDPSMHYTMDYDLWVRLALAGTHIVVLPQILASFRQHADQKTADWDAVHRQLVETANRYLKDGHIPLSRAQRILLASSNRTSLHPLPHQAQTIIRGLLGV